MSIKMMDRNNYLKVSDAAREIGCTRDNLHQHRRRGNLEAVFDGATGLWLIHRNELVRFKYGVHYSSRRAAERKAKENDDNE
jgi:hypothetical protein